MKKIVCELCEGTDFVKEDGMFVCQGCGTKYTLEEAKGMMREVEGGAAPVVASTPVAPVPMGNPNQNQIDNLLILATNAYESSNLKEAETYCNQVIALDAMSYKAWLLKGKAAGWQSTLANMRLTEAAHDFAQAIDFAPEDEKEDLKDQAVEELKDLGIACISLRKDRFAKYPDDEELNGFTQDRKTLLDALLVLLSKGIAAGIPEGYEERIAMLMNEAAVAAFKKVRDDYDNDTHPYSRDFQKTLTGADNCATLIERAIAVSDKDDEADLTRYENMVIIYEYTINMTAYGDTSSYSRSWMLTDKAKSIRRNMIRDWKNKAAAIRNKMAAAKEEEKRREEQAKQARIRAYWEAHKEERAAIDGELKELRDKENSISAELAEIEKKVRETRPNEKVPSEVEAENIRHQIGALEARRAGLGLFSGKEKKQIDEEIAALRGRAEALKGKIAAEKHERQAAIDKILTPLHQRKQELMEQLKASRKRIAALEAELSKDPEA